MLFAYLLLMLPCFHYSMRVISLLVFYSYTAKKTLVLTKSSQVLPCCPMFTEWQHGNKPCKSRTYRKLVATITATEWQHGNNLVKLGKNEMSNRLWYLFPPASRLIPPKINTWVKESTTKKEKALLRGLGITRLNLVSVVWHICNCVIPARTAWTTFTLLTWCDTFKPR